jgi:hypothetical protein
MTGGNRLMTGGKRPGDILPYWNGLHFFDWHLDINGDDERNSQKKSKIEGCLIGTAYVAKLIGSKLCTLVQMIVFHSISDRAYTHRIQLREE